MLELRDVHVTFNAGSPGERHGLRGLTLAANRGELLTVAGPNGSGKSTLLQVISGAVHPSRGSVLLDGVDVTSFSEARRSAWVAQVLDDPRAGTAQHLDIADNLAFALRRGRRRAIRPARGRAGHQSARDALSTLGMGLENRLGEPVESLSAGQRQSLSMIMAAVREPAILLLDEHLAALDPRTARRVRELTIEVAKRLQCVTMMVTHNMRDAIEVGERLIVLKEGRVAAEFTGVEKRSLNAHDLAAFISEDGSPPRVELRQQAYRPSFPDPTTAGQDRPIRPSAGPQVDRIQP